MQRIRNRFAHEIKYENFESLAEKDLAFIKKNFEKFGTDTKRELKYPIEEMLRQIHYYAMDGLRSYEPNIRTLRDEINSEAFKNNLDRLNSERFTKQLNAVFDAMSKAKFKFKPFQRNKNS